MQSPGRLANEEQPLLVTRVSIIPAYNHVSRKAAGKCFLIDQYDGIARPLLVFYNAIFVKSSTNKGLDQGDSTNYWTIEF